MTTVKSLQKALKCFVDQDQYFIKSMYSYFLYLLFMSILKNIFLA